ncbi:hypothetical protein GJ496_009260 [Pomphorhynchus laevis]|nr:hypothetical protein GJ496_009260 [Pomphorhynchus laevis]
MVLFHLLIIFICDSAILLVHSKPSEQNVLNTNPIVLYSNSDELKITTTTYPYRKGRNGFIPNQVQTNEFETFSPPIFIIDFHNITGAYIFGTVPIGWYGYKSLLLLLLTAYSGFASSVACLVINEHDDYRFLSFVTIMYGLKSTDREVRTTKSKGKQTTSYAKKRKPNRKPGRKVTKKSSKSGTFPGTVKNSKSPQPSLNFTESTNLAKAKSVRSIKSKSGNSNYSKNLNSRVSKRKINSKMTNEKVHSMVEKSASETFSNHSDNNTRK